MTGYTIRRAREGDLPRVRELSAALFENERPHDPGMDFAWPTGDEGLQYFRSRAEGDGVCLVAEADTAVVGVLVGGPHVVDSQVVDSRVVGFLVGGIREESWRRVPRTELESMYVDTAWRGRGVGAALVEAFATWSRDAGAEQCLVEAFAGNAGAVAFYESRGFSPVGIQLNRDLI